MKSPGEWVLEASGWRKALRVIVLLPITIPMGVIGIGLYISLMAIALVGMLAGRTAGWLYGIGERGWW